jgi:hypothetical protein
MRSHVKLEVPREAADRSRSHPAVRRESVARAAQAVAAGLVGATGLIHLYLYEDYFSAVPTIGRLFLANFAAGVVLAVLLLRRGWIWPAAGAGYCAATLGAFLWSVQWGLFGYQESLHGTWQTRAAAVEIAGTLVGLIATLLIARRGDQDRGAL